MVNVDVKKTYTQIKKLEIQGARNIAISALKSLKKVKTKKELNDSIELLKKARPTEPMMRNGFKYVQYRFATGSTINKAVNDYLKMIEVALEEISEMGSRRIREGFTVMTHCHSSSVMSVLKKAKDEGKKFNVIATETRPLFQGRKTAKELSDYGIPVTLIVDSAMRSYVNDVDLCLVGSDAITADGHIVNKIGTSSLALAADEARTMFGVVSEIFKFDPDTLSGSYEPIEERDPIEIWNTKSKKIKIENRAFDITPPEYIEFIITEHGVLNPYNISFFVNENYRWMF